MLKRTAPMQLQLCLRANANINRNVDPKWALRCHKITTSTTLIPQRSYHSTAQPQKSSGFVPPSQPQIQIKKKRPYWAYALVLVAAIGAGVFRYLTWHNYPPTVAEKLRKGLHAEMFGSSSSNANSSSRPPNSDSGSKANPDYQLALMYYLEALKEADEVGMFNLSDEYTGLQIKIAEIYENLGMAEEANMIYREMGACFIKALADGSDLSDSLRPHLIQRDLRVALKCAMYEASKNPDMAKMWLLVHFMMAQKEVASKDPEIAKLIEKEKTRTSIDMSIPLAPKKSKHPASKNLEAWMPFRNDLFAARDMFVALCVATGDIGLALQTKLATTEWMALSGCDISDVLMSFCNVGSLFYLQAEELELGASKAARRNSKDISKDISKDREDIKDSTENSHNGPHAPVTIEISSAFGHLDPSEAAKELTSLAQDSLKNANKCFNAILDVVQKLPGSSRRDNGVAEVQALSTYCLGVISLHDGDHEKASELLREARLRAKGCGFQDLVLNAESELENLEKAIASSLDGKPRDYKTPTLNVLLMREEMPSKDNVNGVDSKDVNK